MQRHQRVLSGSNLTPPPTPASAQYIGRTYRAVLPSNFLTPSSASASHSWSLTTGFSLKARADSLTLAQCRSRSGVTPSKARPPSNTTEASHAPCVRGPMIATLPSCQAPSKKVQVRELLEVAIWWVMVLTDSSFYRFAHRQDLDARLGQALQNFRQHGGGRAIWAGVVAHIVGVENDPGMVMTGPGYRPGDYVPVPTALFHRHRIE